MRSDDTKTRAQLTTGPIQRLGAHLEIRVNFVFPTPKWRARVVDTRDL